MKALVCQKYGKINENLKFEETSIPAISPQQILIKVAACGINFPDLLMIEDKYQVKPGLPFIPGGEVSGVIVDLGSEVKSFLPGQRVVALCGWGGFAEYIAIDYDRVYIIPEEIDLKDAAAFAYNYSTAFYALNQRGNLKAGETILILGAAGGVGLAAVNLAKVMGARVIAAASNSEKLDICKKQGADFLINYSSDNLKEKINEYTENKGVDLVFDVVGGEIAEKAFRCLCWQGRYLVVGFASGIIPVMPLNLPLLKGASLTGVIWSNFSRKEPEENRKNFSQILDWFQKGKIKPEIFKEYTLQNAVSGLQDLKNRKVIGKSIVLIDEQ